MADPDQGTVQALVDERPYGDVTPAEVATASQTSQKRQPPPPSMPNLQFSPTPQLRQYDAPTPGQYGLAPGQQQSTPFDAFKDPMLVLAGLSSLFTRHPLMGAMNYAAGAMRGYNQGQTQVFEENQQKFKDAIAATLEQNKVELNRYNAAWDRKKEFDWQRIAPRMYGEAIANKDQLMQAAIESGNWGLVEKILIGRETAQTRLETAVEETVAKAKAVNELKSNLSDDSIELFADMELSGDHSWKTGLGRGIQGKADINAVQKRVAERAKEENLSGADLAQRSAEYQGKKAAQRTIGTYTAKLTQASNAVDGFADQALEASRALPRGNNVPLNQLEQAWEAGTSKPEYYDLGFALFSLINAYARAVNPLGNPRIADKEHALQYLSAAIGPDALEKVIVRLKKEVAVEQQSVRKTQEELRGKTPQDDSGWSAKKVQ